MDEPVFLKRPKPSDGEEELLHMQEEFLKSKESPSAKVIRKRSQNYERKYLNSQESTGSMDLKYSMRVEQQYRNMDEAVSLKRPKPSDGKVDLLSLMQEEFPRSKEPQSAKVKHSEKYAQKSFTTQESTGSMGRKCSKFSQRERKKLKPQQPGLTTSQAGGEMINPNIPKTAVSGDVVDRSLDAVQNTPIAPSSILLGNVVERKYPGEKFEAKPICTLSSENNETGFPEVFISNSKEAQGDRSLFWQKISKEKSVEATRPKCMANEMSHETNDKSVLVDGPWSSEIHTANLQRLRGMSPEEIMREKIKLEATLNPSIVEFIKTRKKQKVLEKENNSTSRSEMEVEPGKSGEITRNRLISKEMEQGSEVTTDENTPHENMMEESALEEAELPQPSIQIIQEAKEKGWVHMNAIEPEKLKWMEDMPKGIDDKPPSDEPYDARFNFQGELLPYKDESLTVDKGLYHHGEEPERPGYTLQELLQLSRSSTQQQRCTALTTLANIMEKSRRGWYDKALQPAPLPALNQRSILLLLRFSLDDTSVAVVTATLQALRALLFSEADEICLDRLVGLGDYSEPYLSVSPHDVKDICNLKDHELAQLDTVAASVRSDIVLRIRYILTEMQPPPIGVTAALDILVRLARYSHQLALNIALTPNLLDTLVQHFLPLSADRLVTEDAVNNLYGVPVVSAIRLCRVFVSYGGRPVAERLDYLKVVHSILSYISTDSGKQDVQLGIESLRLWKILLLYGVALDSVSGAQLTLVSQLRLLLSTHDIESSSELACEHAAALVAVAGCEPSLRPYISPLLSKWSTQLATVSSPTWASTKLVAVALIAVGDITLLKPLWSSNASSVFLSICSSSNLLSDLTPVTERDPSSLPSLGVLMQDKQLQPAVSQNSCIPFLAVVFDTLSKSLCKNELQTVFNEPQFNRYIQELDSFEWSLERSWFTRMELSLVAGIVRAGTLLGKDLGTDKRQIIWKLAIKLISALPADAPLCVKEMLQSTLSNDKLRIETLMSGLNEMKLNDDDNIELVLPKNLASLYENYIVRNGTWDQAAMPKDWLYLPLVNLYAKCKNSYECNGNDSRVVAILLSLELTLPELVHNLSPSLRFSRLVLAYLCDTIFLDGNVSPLLTRAVGNLLRKQYKKLDFTADVPGLSSFTDLFTAMCEHFSATSYGDHGFGMALLVPLAQRHDAHYRKLLWSEHAGALRSLRTPLEKLLIPLKEYLYPIEEDVTLIDSYMSALVRGTVKREWCPVLYVIALHHAAMFMKGDGKLAVRMKEQVGRIGNSTLRNELLNYEPPKL